ncbi:MAG: hypothetical protein JSR80_08400 [Verrucomicrobia bacterium]|nr:hypothetical protein [Verrucomicrobiota bacterium]
MILHYAYQERGTKWLLFLSIILPLRMWGESKALMMESHSVGDLVDLAIFLGIFTLVLGSHLWFWICCMRYRGENLLLKRSPQSALE